MKLSFVSFSVVNALREIFGVLWKTRNNNITVHKEVDIMGRTFAEIDLETTALAECLAH